MTEIARDLVVLSGRYLRPIGLLILGYFVLLLIGGVAEILAAGSYYLLLVSLLSAVSVASILYLTERLGPWWCYVLYAVVLIISGGGSLILGVGSLVSVSLCAYLAIGLLSIVVREQYVIFAMVAVQVVLQSFTLWHEGLGESYLYSAMTILFSGVLWLLVINSTRATLRDAVQKSGISQDVMKRFVDNMNHEMRTPLNAILGFSELIERLSDSDSIRSYARLTQASGRDMLGMINSILDVGRMQKGELELNNAPFELREVVTLLDISLSAKIAETPLIYEINIDPKVPNAVVGDQFKVAQILLNLISNAVKFSSRGKIVLDITEKSRTENTVVVCFKVQDSGIGIDKDRLRNVFKPFYQVDDSLQRAYGGAGLGLAVSKALSDLMGSELVLRSIINEGTSASLIVEFGLQDEEAGGLTLTNALYRDAEQYAELDADEHPLQGITVLIVDDSLTNCMVAQAVLEARGAKAEIAHSGAKALEVIAENETPYDIILMDVAMPEMSGFEATQAIRALGDHYASIPIIAVSVNDSIQQVKQSYEVGMNSFIRKPYTITEMVREILLFCHPKALLALDDGDDDSLFDIEKALAEHENSMESYLDTVRVIVAQQPHNIDLFKDAVDARKTNTAIFWLRRLAHGARSVGALGLYKYLMEIEQRLNGDGDIWELRAMESSVVRRVHADSHKLLTLLEDTYQVSLDEDWS